MLRLRTLGGFSLERDGVTLDGVGARRKTLALLVLLAAARRQGISRDRLVAYLWPESDAERARGALKQALHVVRRELGPPDIVVGTSELRLNPARIQSDVDAFLTALEEGRPERAAAVYGGPFLDGFHLSGAAEFEQWVATQRDQLAHRHATALEQLARAAEAGGDHRAAIDLWRRLRSEDPFSAQATLGLMNALGAVGERAAAIRYAAVHGALLRDELGSPPDEAVVALAERLAEEPDPPKAAPGPVRRPPTRSSHEATPRASVRAEDSAPAHRGGRGRRMRAASLGAALLVLGLAVSVVGDRSRAGAAIGATAVNHSIVVLPFANADRDPANEYFVHGFAAELIGALGRVEGLRVAAQSAALALTDRGLDARAIADTLGAATVLEGAVWRTGDRLKVAVRLVNARDEGVLWSETYDREVSDVFTIQEELVRATVGALRGRQTPGGAARLVGRPTHDLEAYELYLRARHSWTLPSRDRLERATVYYRQAIERDPAFAMAYAGLAQTYANVSSYAYVAPAQALARAKVAAERAIQLDPDLAEAHAAHGFVLTSELDFAAAEAAFRRAIALNPNLAWGHHGYSLLLMMLGRTDEALEHNRRALLLDPLSLPANATRGIILGQRSQYASARAELEKALALAPDYPLTLFYLGVTRAAEGAYEEALPLLEEAARQAPEFAGVPGALAHVYHHLGRRSAADSILTDLLQRAAGERPRVNLAFAYGVRGQADLAFPILERVRWDKPSLIALRADPLLNGLRADPRYARLIRRVEADGSRSTGVSPDDRDLTPR